MTIKIDLTLLLRSILCVCNFYEKGRNTNDIIKTYYRNYYNATAHEGVFCVIIIVTACLADSTAISCATPSMNPSV